MWGLFSMTLWLEGTLADLSNMTVNFFSKHRSPSECEHKNQMRIEIAGMSREVCESCGKVSLTFLEDHFRPDRYDETLEMASVPED
jgi:hypothetical protein